MLKPKIFCYEPKYQQDLEAFLKVTSAGPAFLFDPVNKHKDFRNIPEVYQSNNGQFWLMLHSNNIIGMIALKNLSTTTGEVKRLNIHPDFRGSGFGELLFKHLISYAQENDFKFLRLDSKRELKAALHLYNKFGFSEIDRYNDNPDADIFMELALI